MSLAGFKKQLNKANQVSKMGRKKPFPWTEFYFVVSNFILMSTLDLDLDLSDKW